MKHYRRVLVGIALHDSDRHLLEQARQIAPAAVIELLHTCERPVSVAAHLGGDCERQTRAEAFPAMKALAEMAGSDAGHIHIVFGNAADELCSHAEKTAADLIVTGSHAASGLRAILGSTAHGVVQQAPCDVLTVRLRTA